ncbi:MAG: DNA polymerase Y family protein [Verrucomicrobiota bacterium]
MALHLPSLPLEALLRHQPDKRRFPCAVAATEKTDTSVPILALNRRAAAFRLQPGFSITRALARCPQLQVLPRDPEAESLALRDLLEVAESLTPDFELTTSDTLLLKLRGCPGPGQAVVAAARSEHQPRRPADAGPHPSTPHPPPQSYGAAGFSLGTFHSCVSRLGLPAQLALGPTPDLAHLFSLCPATSYRLVFRGPSSRWSRGPHLPDPLCDVPQNVFHVLPIALAQALPLLELQTSNFDLLQQWGLRHLGDLAQLPRQDLAERLGPEIARLHDILHAKYHRPLTLVRPIESFTSITQLEHPIESSQALVFLLRKILGNLCNQLNAKYIKAQSIHLELKLENGCLKQIEIHLPEPAITPEILLAPLQSRLESLRLSAPVSTLKLSLISGEASDVQHQLFGHHIRQPHRLTSTFIRLSALLGEDRIGFPVPHFTHRPDSFHLAPAQTLFTRGDQREKGHSCPAAAARGTTHHRPAGLPLSRFRPPLEIAVAFDLPAGQRRHPDPLALLTGPHRGRILNSHGPFPLSGHWWSPAESWQQLEWDIELETHHLLRLSHTPPDHWHLQGHYA